MKFEKIFVTFIMVQIFSGPTKLWAKGGTSNELGFSLMYDSLASSDGNLSTMNLSGFYLVPAKAVCAGAEFEYSKLANSSYTAKSLELGGLVKYWLMDPGSGFAFNMFAGLALGNGSDGFKNYSTMTVKTGPEFAYFISDAVSISTRLQYAMRKTDTSYKGLGIRSGLSLFF